MSEDPGYGKPPVRKQFRKGRSGSPNGRPKGAKNVLTLLEEAANETLFVNENGQQKKRSKLDISLRQLVNKAAGGDAKAMAFLIANMKTQEEQKQTHGSSGPGLTDADQQVLAVIAQRITTFDKGDQNV